MKKTIALVFAMLLMGCTTTTTTKVTKYNEKGELVYSQTTTKKKNTAVEKTKEVGKGISDGVVSGYEWVKDKVTPESTQKETVIIEKEGSPSSSQKKK